MEVKGRRNKKSHDVLFMSLQMVFGVLGGVLIAALWLALKPVTILDAPPRPDEPKTDRHAVQYIRGRPPGRGAQGARKQKAFLDRIPGQLAFAEEDVNRWLAGVYASKERTIRIEGIDLTLGPRVPAVRMVDDEMEIGLEIGMDRAGGTRTLVAQARGRFAARDGRQVFVPEKIYLGSCPLPWNLGGRVVYEKLMSLYPVSDYVRDAWASLDRATIDRGRMELVIGGSAAPAPVESAAPAAPDATVPAPAAPAAIAPAASEATPAPAAAPTAVPAANDDAAATELPAPAAVDTPPPVAPDSDVLPAAEVPAPASESSTAAPPASAPAP